MKRAGGRRYYRPDDMLLLGGIKKLLHDDGMTIKGVQKLLREQGVRHVTALAPPLDAAAAPRQMPPPARRPVREDVEEAEIVAAEDEVPPAPFIEAEPPEATVLSFPGRTPAEADESDAEMAEAPAGEDAAPADPAHAASAEGEDGSAAPAPEKTEDAAEPTAEDMPEAGPVDAEPGPDLAEVGGWASPPERFSEDASVEEESEATEAEAAFGSGPDSDDVEIGAVEDGPHPRAATPDPEPAPVPSPGDFADRAGEAAADHEAPPAPPDPASAMAVHSAPPAGLLGPILAADRGALRRRRDRLAGPVIRLSAVIERMGHGPS
ncbi:hypothetical protein GCM10011392_31350 [Wenxinia marina]|nr:hypothetical protein GCM10011392_31350 [Wenxinia marina]